jgi:hypothetical protein
MENRASQRPQRVPAADARGVDQQHEGADALSRERGASDRMRMPHERDQSAGATGQSQTSAQHEVIGQAAADLEHGLQDTDCRNQPAYARSRTSDLTRAPSRTQRASACAPARLGRVARRMRRTGG